MHEHWEKHRFNSDSQPIDAGVKRKDKCISTALHADTVCLSFS